MRELDQNKLKQILKSRLFSIPEEIRNFLPPILRSQKINWFITSDDDYFLLSFGDDSEQKRINENASKNLHPYPGLISKDDQLKTAFKINKAKNIFIEDCVVDNVFSFSPSKDSTIIICNHTQKLNIEGLGINSFVMKLGYLIFFGDEINFFNLYENLDDLIASSVSRWRSDYDQQSSRK